MGSGRGELPGGSGRSTGTPQRHGRHHPIRHAGATGYQERWRGGGKGAGVADHEQVAPKSGRTASSTDRGIGAPARFVGWPDVNRACPPFTGVWDGAITKEGWWTA